MSSKHFFKFSQLKPQEVTEAGWRMKASQENFPILQGMSIYKLLLKRNAVREPHWHANADELGYCLKGKLLINIYATNDERESFIVNEGDVFFIPSGSLHHVENLQEDDSLVILAFSNDSVEDFGLSGTLGAFSDAVLGNTWGVKKDIFKTFKRTTKNNFVTFREGEADLSTTSNYVSKYHFKLEASEPILINHGGSARMAKQSFWKILKNQALYSLILTDQGMREPHWHPETQELGYVSKGMGRMTVLSPEGIIDTYIMEEGDIYFIPKGYPHHIENLGKENLHILVFFDQNMPEDIGFTGSIRSFSDEVLSASTGQEKAFFSSLEKYNQDLFIVNRINPLDPI